MIYGESYGTPAEYKGQYFDSQTEVAWARFFDVSGMPFVREPECFQFPPVTFKEYAFPATIYTPDYWLPEQDMYVEVKNGAEQENAASKLWSLARYSGKPGMLADGMPHNASLYLFSPTHWNKESTDMPYGCDVWFPNFKWIPTEARNPVLRAIIVGHLKDARHGWKSVVSPMVKLADEKRRKELRANRHVFEPKTPTPDN